MQYKTVIPTLHCKIATQIKHALPTMSMVIGQTGQGVINHVERAMKIRLLNTEIAHANL